MPHLFCFGLGYTASLAARQALALGWTVAGTTRTGTADVPEAVTVHRLDEDTPMPELARLLAPATHVLVSVPPGAEGDPLLARHGETLAALAPQWAWLGYLSTTGVYGDQGGAWVDEDTPVAPDVPRSERRVAAERGWAALGAPLHVFRLAGIYGPGRNALESVRAGRARRLIKPGHVFCRIHVADAAQVVAASLEAPRAEGRVYNVCDDLPAPPQDVITEACRLLGVTPPPEEPFDQVTDLSPMARSFYADCKRVRNDRLKSDLGVRLSYPTYREGLAALLAGDPKP